MVFNNNITLQLFKQSKRQLMVNQGLEDICLHESLDFACFCSSFCCYLVF